MTNARNLDRFPWKFAVQQPLQRCLVPASSFSEPHPTETIPNPKGERKPWKAAAWFKLKGNEPRPPFAFAGLMRKWSWEKDGLQKKADDTSVEIAAYAFLTCDPNELVAPIHPKAMPVILDPSDYDQWLNGEAGEAAELQKPFDAHRMEIAFVGEKKDEMT